MATILDLIRRRNLLAPNSFRDDNTTFGSTLGPTVGSTMSPTPMHRPLLDTPTFTPETSAQDRFNAFLSSMPQRSNYNPSLLRRILSGAVAGISGKPEETEHLAYAPYERAVGDWRTQLQPMQESANLERQSNMIGRQTYSSELNNVRQFNRDTMNDENADLSRAELNRHNMAVETETQKRDEAKAQHDSQMNELRRYHNENPDSKPYFGGPTVLYWDQKTKKVVDTKIPTGHVSDEEKINLGKEARLEEISAQGEQTRETEGVKQSDREISNVKFETANNQQQRWLNNAKQLMREQPNGLGRFITLDPNDPKGFKIEKAGSYMFSNNPKGPSDAETKQINDYINNTLPPKAAASSVTNAKGSNTQVIDKNAPKTFGTDKTITKEGTDYIKTDPITKAKYKFDPVKRIWNLIPEQK